MKRLLNMASSQVYFKCNGSWYVQVEGLAKGYSLLVILTNLWLKEHEFALRQEKPVRSEIQPMNEKKNGFAYAAAGK